MEINVFDDNKDFLFISTSSNYIAFNLIRDDNKIYIRLLITFNII